MEVFQDYQKVKVLNGIREHYISERLSFCRHLRLNLGSKIDFV